VSGAERLLFLPPSLSFQPLGLAAYPSLHPDCLTEVGGTKLTFR